jgi:hypothetical protein
MKTFLTAGAVLVAAILFAMPAGARTQASSGDTCTATGNGTAYTLSITLPSNAVEQGAFAFGAPGGVSVTGIKITGNPGKYSTDNLPANTSAGWILTNPTYVPPGSQVSAVVTVTKSITGSFTVVPATATTNGQAMTYFDPIACSIAKGTAPPSNKFTVQQHFVWAGGMWHTFATVPGAGRLNVGGKGTQKPLIRTRTVKVSGGKTKLSIVPTSLGKARLAATGSLKLTLLVEFSPTGGTPANKSFAVTLKK